MRGALTALLRLGENLGKLIFTIGCSILACCLKNQNHNGQGGTSIEGLFSAIRKAQSWKTGFPSQLPASAVNVLMVPCTRKAVPSNGTGNGSSGLS
ncbi:unnamed protein product [Linum trigynum]|uniref:Uncharacterized protein n=1 Tax=Linum trigynum TaxID=586398 RepID=A0AAV2EPX5_9ROSI